MTAFPIGFLTFRAMCIERISTEQHKLGHHCPDWSPSGPITFKLAIRIIVAMVRTNLLNEVSTSGRRRWLRVNELPWSRALTYSMLRAGVLQSILLTYPGCVKGLRLIDGDSLDRYLEGLANKEFTPSPCKRGKGLGRPKKPNCPDGVSVEA